MEAMKSSCFCRQLFGFFGGSAWKKAQAGEIISSANRHSIIFDQFIRLLETCRENSVFVRLKISGRSNQQGFNNYNNPLISVRRLISCRFPAVVRVPYEADDHWQNRFAAFPLYLQSEHRRPDSRVAIRVHSPLPHLEMAFKCIVYNVYVREAHLTLTSFHSTTLHSESTMAITAWDAPLNLIFRTVINAVLGASIEVRKDTADPQREMLQVQREYHHIMIYTGMKTKAVWFHSVWNSVLDSPGH